MDFKEIYIENYRNNNNKPETIFDVIRIGEGSRIIRSKVNGPLYLNRNTQVGPDVVLGKYFGMNESCYIARSKVGSYGAIGARTAINPFNHPIDWLSTNEFQYHPNSFDWIEEYNKFKRIDRLAEEIPHCEIGNDVWTGHNVNIMGGVHIGDGAVIGAGAVVTKNVPPYAIVGGVPAKIIKYRFSEKIIERLLKVKWWEFDLSLLSGLNFRDLEDCLPRLEEIKEKNTN